MNSQKIELHSANETTEQLSFRNDLLNLLHEKIIPEVRRMGESKIEFGDEKSNQSNWNSWWLDRTDAEPMTMYSPLRCDDCPELLRNSCNISEIHICKYTNTFFGDAIYTVNPPSEITLDLTFPKD
jgi:hypothetical protein